MKRILLVAACLAAGLGLVVTTAGAAPGGTVPVTGSGPELSFTGTCEPPQVTVATAATAVPIVGFDPVTLDGLTLQRVVDQVCQAAADLQDHDKLKGRRLAEAVDALNALGGSWVLGA